MKKGFTLIELLAVIVILAILALIAIPSLNKIIENSKKESAKISARVYMDAVEDYNVLAELKDNVYLKDNVTYNCLKSTIIDGKNNLPLNEIVSIKGLKPSGMNDYLSLGSKGEVEFGELNIDGYLITIENKEIVSAIKGKKVSAEMLSLNYSEQTMEKGSSFKIKETFTPINTSDQRVLYRSLDSSIASVSDTGVVTALKNGSTKIIVESKENKNIKAECIIKVVTSASSVTITPSEGTIDVASTIQLVGIIEPNDVTTNSLVWKSDDESIAHVDENGLVTGMSAGTTTIKAKTVNGKESTVTITVNESPSKSGPINIYNFDYTGKIEEFKVPNTGRYKLEVWGAEGGNGNAYNQKLLPGKGGYSTGIITLESGTIVYVRAGGQGKVVTNNNNGVVIEGGFNGGGNNKSTKDWSVGSGGGASDIRIGHDTFYSRVIVAGGGGASASVNNNSYGGSGGAGGGEVGLRSSNHRSNKYQSGYPGTQTEGGEGYKNNANGQTYVASGVFGRGANNSGKGFVNGGGGGGWYGGGSGYCAGSAGGSGYVYTEKTASSNIRAYELGTSYYLKDAETIAGDKSFLSPDGVEEVGHSGNGYVRISYLGK